MTYHLFGNIITAKGIAANNRGETEGNRTTLPKVFFGDDLRVTLSAESIRFALRHRWQLDGIAVNRVWDEDNQVNALVLAKESVKYDPDRFIDDDAMGYFEAKAGKGNEPQKRRGALEVTRAISLESADKIQVTFNSKSGAKDRNSIYSTEMISTRFQHGFGISPQRLVKSERIVPILTGLIRLSQIGGNHARFMYDYAPESAILRWSHYPVPQILYCFEQREHDVLSAPRLIQLVEIEEIPAEEIWVLGGYAFTDEARQLAQKGVHVFPSPRKGTSALIERICEDLSITVDSQLLQSIQIPSRSDAKTITA